MAAQAAPERAALAALAEAMAMQLAAPVDRARTVAQPPAVAAVAVEIPGTRLAAAAVAVAQAAVQLPGLERVALAVLAGRPVQEQAEMPGPAMAERWQEATLATLLAGKGRVAQQAHPLVGKELAV